MAKTSIEWTDFSISPIRARSKETGKVFHFCEKISPGCANCYAATMAQRFGLPDYIKANRDKVEFFLDESKLQDVLRRKKPTRYFWEDCSDLFGAWVPDEWIDRCFAVMALTPQHTHQVLTKRADRMQDYINRLSKSIGHLEAAARAMGWTFKFTHGNRDIPLLPWPIRNIWLGFSAEDQERFNQRAVQTAKLMRDGWTVFVSAEPLLGPIVMEGHEGELAMHFLAKPGIAWVIIGGESGHGARPCDINWTRDIIKQCQTAGVPVFHKQVGSNANWGGSGIASWGQDNRQMIRDKKGGDPAEWPEDLRVREFPKVTACGR